jgi:hypothetical protein
MVQSIGKRSKVVTGEPIDKPRPFVKSAGFGLYMAGLACMLGATLGHFSGGLGMGLDIAGVVFFGAGLVCLVRWRKRERTWRVSGKWPS